MERVAVHGQRRDRHLPLIERGAEARERTGVGEQRLGIAVGGPEVAARRQLDRPHAQRREAVERRLERQRRVEHREDADSHAVSPLVEALRAYRPSAGARLMLCRS
jgi:hypothetical protein